MILSTATPTLCYCVGLQAHKLTYFTNRTSLLYSSPVTLVGLVCYIRPVISLLTSNLYSISPVILLQVVCCLGPEILLLVVCCISPAALLQVVFCISPVTCYKHSTLSAQ